MPSLWSGAITFGLVSIPVRLETSQRSKQLGFNLLHRECGQRINQKQYCAGCDRLVDRDELVRGYQYEKNHYVVLEPQDFEGAEGEASRNIEVVAFVERSAIKPVHLSRTYYLVPEEGAEKGYLLLLKGMQKTDRVAITRFVMRGKEYIGAVGFAGSGLMLHVLFHKGEFRQLEEIINLPNVELKKKELDLARQIIENLTEEFSEEMLVNRYRDRLLEIIRQKVEGEQVTVSERKKPAKVVDLMEALKRSLEVTAERKPVARIEAREQKVKRAKRKRA
jgi:DNA end-binding protein Ku